MTWAGRGWKSDHSRTSPRTSQFDDLHGACSLARGSRTSYAATVFVWRGVPIASARGMSNDSDCATIAQPDLEQLCRRSKTTAIWHLLARNQTKRLSKNDLLNLACVAMRISGLHMHTSFKAQAGCCRLGASGAIMCKLGSKPARIIIDYYFPFASQL